MNFVAALIAAFKPLWPVMAAQSGIGMVFAHVALSMRGVRYRWLLLATLMVGGFIVATYSASQALVMLLNLQAQYPSPTYQWWLYALNVPADWPPSLQAVVHRWVVTTAGVSVFLTMAPVIALAAGSNHRRLNRPSMLVKRPRAIVRGASDNHGHADWMGDREQRQRFPGPNPCYGGLVVGESYRPDQDKAAGWVFKPDNPRTWGRGGKAPLLIDPCTDGPTHSLIFSGPGGFKSMAAVSTLLYWKASAVVLDPSEELGPMLRREKEAAGQRVIQLSLDGNESFDVLDWIDIDSPEAEVNIRAAVSWAYGDAAATRQRSPEEQFFRPMGKDMVVCLLAHMLYDPDLPCEQKTVATLRVGISTPEDQMPGLLQRIHAGSHSLMARQLAGVLMGIVADTFSGIYANANSATNWLSTPAYAKMLSGSSFKSRDILDGNTIVFLQLPSKTLSETPALGRMIIGSLLNQAYEARGEIGPYDEHGRPSGRILFLLDEVYQLGHLNILQTARDLGRKYRITLQLLYQSVGQMQDQWGPDGTQAWFDGVSWRAYGAIQNMQTAEDVSKACGTYSVMAVSEGDNTGRSGKGFEVGSRSSGSNQSTHEVKRPLIFPTELTQDVRSDELFVLARGCKPIRCGRAIYFRRPEMVSRIEETRLRMPTGKAA